MAEAPTRKLAVLLHADVVGSTALVRIDETLAHERTLLNVILGYTETPGESIAAALTAAKKAVALDDKDPAAYLTLGRVHIVRGEHDTSIAELETSIRLNPSFAPAYFGLGFSLGLAGRPTKRWKLSRWPYDLTHATH